MRYRLDIVAASVTDVVTFAGGWMFDRVMAGWDVTVLIAGSEDVRPIQILGADTMDLETALGMWTQRAHPHALAVSADLFARDARVRRGVLEALEHGTTEVTLWGGVVAVGTRADGRLCAAPAERCSPGVQSAGAQRISGAGGVGGLDGSFPQPRAQLSVGGCGLDSGELTLRRDQYFADGLTVGDKP